jgi:ribosome-associated protein
MQEKKASDIVVMDLRKIKNAVADFFVICSGNSDKQLDAISDSIDAEVFKKLQENPWHTEGKNNKEWMLLDYINVGRPRLPQRSPRILRIGAIVG